MNRRYLVYRPVELSSDSPVSPQVETGVVESLGLTHRILVVDSPAVEPDFMPDRMERTVSPEICRFDVVIGVRVKAFVGRHELVELMDDQKDRIQLPRVGHEGVKRNVGSVLSETERVIGTVRQQVWMGAAPSRFYPGRVDRSGEILYSQATLAGSFVVRRVVRARGRGARSLEPVDPTPESVSRIDLHRAVGSALRRPETGLRVEISSHHPESEFACDSGMVFQKLSDLKPEGIVPTIWILRRPDVNQHERLAFVDDLALRIFLQQRSEELDFLLECSLAVEVLVEDILVKAAQQRNELESSSQLCPCRIEIAGIVANVLVVNPEGRRAR